MAASVLLDTDVLIEYLRGRPQAIAFLESLTASLLVSAASVAELFAGVRGRTEQTALEQFLLAFEVVPITDRLARAGGLLRRQYGPSHGAGLIDCVIAATAKERGTRLFTFNARHFPSLTEVTSPYSRE